LGGFASGSCSSVHCSEETFLSPQNELGASEATIFGFIGFGSSVHCSKELELFGAMPNRA